MQPRLRTALEIASRSIILRRRLPARFNGVPLFVSPEGGLRYWHRNLDRVDRGLLDWAERLVKSGYVVWDVGANVGLFSFASAARTGTEGRVLAIEPDGWLVNLLRRSSALPGKRGPIEVLGCAVADAIAIDRLNIAHRARSTNFLSRSAREDGSPLGTQTGGTRVSHLVVTITLDWLLDHYEPPDLLKLDVEGSEELVLRGSQRLLTDTRPQIISEVPEERREVFLATLRRPDYRFFDVDKPFSDTGWPETKKPSFNTLAVPAEKL